MKNLSKCQEMVTIQQENLDYLYHQKHYILIGIDLSTHTKKKYEYSSTN